MAKWEYLEVYVLPSGVWTDNTGRTGAPTRLYNGWVTSATLLNELGAEGWELAGVVPSDGAYRLLLKRPWLQQIEEAEELLSSVGMGRFSAD